jgi:hypothetical protein
MKFCVALSILLSTLVADASSLRDLYLPPWYDKAARQIFQLELNDLKMDRIQLHLPCTISVNQQIIEVTNGVAKATLFIDLRKTPSTFPLMIMAVDANGRMTEYKKLICHLSLVALPVQVYVQGETFAITNLTEEPFEVERAENLVITSQGERHIHGTLKGNGRLKLKGRALILLIPTARAEAGK